MTGQVAGLMRASMKFDVARAESLAQEMGDPRFVGPDGEANAADFLAERFAGMGLDVERREVFGSRFPGRVGPWVAWLGYGLLVSSTFGLVVRENLLLVMGGLALSFASRRWIDGVVRSRIRPGRRRPPVGTAPVLIATLPGDRPKRARVVFQSVISGLKPDPFQFSFRGPSRKSAALALLVIIPFLVAWAVLVLRCGFLLFPMRTGLLKPFRFLTRFVIPPSLVLMWLGIVIYLFRSRRISNRLAVRDHPDRRGLAILLEMARTWPRTGSRPIEPVFAVAGGQALDHAGSREVVRLLKSRWSTEPVLVVLLFGPGGGEELWLGTNAPAARGLQQLAEEAARSLWIPFQHDDPFTLLSLWPFDESIPALSLVGAAPGADEEGSIDPQALSRVAQLATEVSLRWGRTSAEASGDQVGPRLRRPQPDDRRGLS